MRVFQRYVLLAILGRKDRAKHTAGRRAFLDARFQTGDEGAAGRKVILEERTKQECLSHIRIFMDGLTPKSPCFYFIAEESADMRKSIRCFAAVMMVYLATM